jgi:hypothetical protein
MKQEGWAQKRHFRLNFAQSSNKGLFDTPLLAVRRFYFLAKNGEF